ncbi:MAG: hemagglutinin, partial [Candidatus Komeilibacteria bacterium]|nr:hemagglutinin [Candidatus Komeilibacteria bacterium]
VTEADYTTATWAAYQTIVGDNVVTDQNTQDEVDAATENITAAQEDLVEISELTSAISAANTKLANAVEGDEVGQYAVGSKDIFATAIFAAQTVLDDEAATQAQVNTAVTDLATADDIFEDGRVNE